MREIADDPLQLARSWIFHDLGHIGGWITKLSVAGILPPFTC
ncbi:MAG: hypothetical protein OXD01_01010 [Gammaproteobacteria bacterium]|nr:hypothetical protein [Gammaproteobacteria bacterium]